VAAIVSALVHSRELFMAMPNHKEKASAVVTESRSYSRSKLIRHSHTWRIDNFRLIQEADYLVSSKITAEGYDGLKWYLRICPQGSIGGNKDYMSLFLSLDSSSETEVQAGFKIFILNNKLEEIATNGRSFRRWLPGHEMGFYEFVKRDHLLKCLDEVSSDELNVKCEISVAVNTVDICGKDELIRPVFPVEYLNQ